MSIVLGIDGGGTRTRALLVAADGRVLGAGWAPASNVNNLGLDRAVERWREATAAAWAQAAQAPRPADACFVGCAGIKSAVDCARLGARATEAGLGSAGHCIAANDTEAALAGGLAGAPGIVVIGGTGSFCLGRDAAGRTARCGGWGWLLDDVGSGFFLAREALRAAAFAADGRGRATALTAPLLAHFQISDPDELLASLYEAGADAARLAALAPLVLSSASAGDAVATQILERGAAGLAELVREVATRLALAAPAVILSGGVATSGAPYQPMIEREIRAMLPGAVLAQAQLPAVAGAALRALELIGVAPSPALIRTLQSDCQRAGLLSAADPSSP